MSGIASTGWSSSASRLRAVLSLRGAFLLAFASAAPSLSAQSAAATSKAAAPAGDPRAAWLADAKSAMTSFAWLAGEWEGVATVRMGNGGSMKLVQRESVTSAAFGTALLIQGRGNMKDASGADRQLWDAAGLFAYNAPSKAFSFSSASGSGMAQTFAVIAQGEGFTWYYTEADGARVRYVITHTPDDMWKEIGERSTDAGATWSTTIELLLARKR